MEQDNVEKQKQELKKWKDNGLGIMQSTYVERMAGREESFTVTALSLTAAEETCSLWCSKRFHFCTFWYSAIKLVEKTFVETSAEQPGL